MSMNNKKSISIMKQMKNILRSRLMTAAAITAGLALAACQSDNEVETPQPEAQGTLCEVPATITGETRATTMTGDGASTKLTSVFNATDVVYVRSGGSVDTGTLTPTADGAEASTLTGTLYGTYSKYASMELLLSPTTLSAPTDIRYDDQIGTQASMLAHTFALTTVSVTEKSGTAIKTSKGEFVPMQSLLCLQLKLMEGTSDVTSEATVADLEINSNHGLYYGYDFSTGTWLNNSSTITFNGIGLNTSGGKVWLAIPASSGGTTHRLTFTVTFGGKMYVGSKVKSGGFTNGTYYYMSDPIELSNKVLPTITAHSGTVPTVNSYSIYNWSTSDVADVTIQGASLGYGFKFSGGGQVTLSNLNATFSGTDAGCLRVFSNDLEIKLDGDVNFISSPTSPYSIYNAGRKVTLDATSSGTHFLYLRCKSNDNSHKGFTNPSTSNVVAASGCTVTPPADDSYSTNSDGTYTWTWTVVKD